MNLVTLVTDVNYETWVEIIKMKVKNTFNLKM